MTILTARQNLVAESRELISKAKLGRITTTLPIRPQFNLGFSYQI